MSYTDDELIETLQQIYEDKGHTSSTLLFDSSNNYPTPPTYINRFGSMDEAREVADVPVNSSTLSDEQILDKIEECYEKHGDTKVSTIESDDDMPSYATIYNKLGNLRDIREKLGIPKSHSINSDDWSRENKYSDDFLLTHLENTFDKFGDTKTKTLNNSDGPSSQAYRSHFGSVSEARQMADIPPEHTYQNKATDVFGRYKQYKSDDNVYVYVIKLMSDTDEVFYYVGSTTSGYNGFSNRLNSHATEFTNSAVYSIDGLNIMSSNKNINKDTTYEVTDIINVDTYSISHNDEYIINSFAQNKEREKMLQIAINKQTTNVFGGR